MKILLAVAALAVSCAGQEANCHSNGSITVCDDPPQTHNVCAPIEVRKATGQKCSTVISQSKHWYAPISQSENIRLRDAGDRWTITALDGENCQQNGQIIVCDMPAQTHRSCDNISQGEGAPAHFKCHSYTVHPKHYYAPVSLTGTIHTKEGDTVQVTAFDKPAHYSQEVCSKDGKLIACSYESEKQTTGKLIDVQRISTAGGVTRAGCFCLAVQIGDISYLSRYEPDSWPFPVYDPSELVVGGEIRVRVVGGNLYIEYPNGGELQAGINRRVQLTADTQPATCAQLAVQQ